MVRRFILSYKAAMPVLETQILAFPVLVVLLATASFLLGGCCTPWLWWISVATVLAWPWCRRRPIKEALIVDCCFLAILVLLWLLTPMTLDAVRNPDSGNYHLPTIRLLVRGWNPVRDPEATGVLADLGLEKEGMTYVSVAFLPKVAGVFDACSAWFCADPTSLTFPLKFFLFAGVVFAAVRAFRETWLCGIVSAIAVVKLAPVESHVDHCLALASAGLLLTMLENRKAGHLRFLPLFVFTFWMMTLKLPGCIAAFGFWAIFSSTYLVTHWTTSKVTITRLAIMVVMLTVAMGLTSFNPYGTAFRDHGHPLYPLRSVDPERHPIQNIPADCKVGNDDWKSMGYVGCLFNAYVMPRFVRGYYNRKLHRTDFAPHQYVWDYSFHDTGKRSPLRLRERIWLWLPLIALFAIPQCRLFGAMMLFGLMALPKEYMGLMRYYPWIPALKAIAIGSLLAWVAGRRVVFEKAVNVSMAIFLLYVFAVSAKEAFSVFRLKVHEMETSRSVVYACLRNGPRIPLDYPLEGKPRYPDGKTQMNNAILLLDSLGRNDTIVRSRPPGQIDGLTVTRFGYYIESDNIEGTRPMRKTFLDKILLLGKTATDYFGILWRRLSGVKLCLPIESPT